MISIRENNGFVVIRGKRKRHDAMAKDETKQYGFLFMTSRTYPGNQALMPGAEVQFGNPVSVSEKDQ